MEELAPRGASAPEVHAGAFRGTQCLLKVLGDGPKSVFVGLNLGPAALSRQLGQVKLANECGQDVGTLEVEVVARTVEICGHQTDGVESVLLPVGLAHLDARDLRYGVPLVRGFEGPGEQMFLLHWLGTVLGVDARRTEEEELLHAVPVGGIDHVGLDLYIVADEIGGVGVVGQNASHLRRGQEDIVWAFLFEEAADRRLVGQVQFAAVAQEKILVPFRLKSTDDG